MDDRNLIWAEPIEAQPFCILQAVFAVALFRSRPMWRDTDVHFAAAYSAVPFFGTKKGTAL